MPLASFYLINVFNHNYVKALVFLLIGHARQLTKLALRKPTVDKLLAKQQEDTEFFANFIVKDSIQKGLAKYLEALKQKN